MRKFLIALAVIPTALVAQPVTVEKSVQCERAEVVIKELLLGEYKEQPVWIGNDQVSRYSVFANPKTGSWTLLQFNEKIACVLGSGGSSELIPPEPTV